MPALDHGFDFSLGQLFGQQRLDFINEPLSVLTSLGDTDLYFFVDFRFELKEAQVFKNGF